MTDMTAHLDELIDYDGTRRREKRQRRRQMRIVDALTADQTHGDHFALAGQTSQGWDAFVREVMERHESETDNNELDRPTSEEGVPQEGTVSNNIGVASDEADASEIVGRAMIILFTRNVFSILWVALIFFLISALFVFNIFEVYEEIGVSWADLTGATLSALAGALVISLFYKIRKVVK